MKLPYVLLVECRLNDFPFTIRDFLAKLWRKHCETFFPSVDHLGPARVIHVEGIRDNTRCRQHTAVTKCERWRFWKVSKTIEHRDSKWLDLPRIVLNPSMTRHLANHANITNVEVGRDAVYFTWCSTDCGGNLLLEPCAHSGIRNDNRVWRKDVAIRWRRVEISDNRLNNLSQVCDIRDPQTSTKISCHVAYPSADDIQVSTARTLYCRGV
ncbi:unannotated protein [freshwater metagenome]|uniref:Unannotated protein n=1 Tax=freshwater metagenome TaxID=449393 RepID=A0A6J6LZ69_9ZZZZ